jgi:hypothetical protein
MAGFKKDEELELHVLPKPRSFLDSLLESSADTATMFPKNVAGSLLQLAPEMGARLRDAALLLELRHEPVWALIPYRFEVK